VQVRLGLWLQRLVFSERELTFTFALYVIGRPSVCLSYVYLSVKLVHPTQAIEIFGNVSTLFGTLAIAPSADIQVKFYGDRPRETVRRGS